MLPYWSGDERPRPLGFLGTGSSAGRRLRAGAAERGVPRANGQLDRPPTVRYRNSWRGEHPGEAKLMTAVVINHLHLSVPVDHVAELVRREFPPVFDTCAGFRRFYLVKTAEDRATAVIVWDSPEAARE